MPKKTYSGKIINQINGLQKWHFSLLIKLNLISKDIL